MPQQPVTQARKVLDWIQIGLAFLVGFGRGLVRKPSQVPPLKTNFTVDVLRADDFLVMSLDLQNLALLPAQGTRPVRLARAQVSESRIVVALPPQSFGEESFFETSPGVKPQPPDPDAGKDQSEGLPDGPARVRMSAPTYLVFRIGDHVLPIPYTIEGILDALSRCELVNSDVIANPFVYEWNGEWGIEHIATGSTATGPAMPRVLFTAIETPYRLVISPRPPHAGSTRQRRSGPASRQSFGIRGWE